MKKLLLIVILFSLIIPSVVSEESDVDLYLFYGQRCPHCSQEKVFLDEIKEEYPQLNIIEKEIYFNDKNRELFIQMSNSYGEEIQGVPTIFLNGKVGVTITTVGKIFTSFITIIGIGFVAVPTGLLTSALSKTSE